MEKPLAIVKRIDIVSFIFPKEKTGEVFAVMDSLCAKGDDGWYIDRNGTEILDFSNEVTDVLQDEFFLENTAPESIAQLRKTATPWR